MNRAVLLICLHFCLTTGHAQIEELADRSWANADIEALERYRTDPLCLPCLTASQITTLPGFNRTSASRVVRAAQAGLATLQHIADSACLTIDQSIILFSCTTLDCQCEPLIESARLQQRLYAVDGSPPDMTTRIDVDGRSGGVGGVYRTNADGTLHEGWAMFTSDELNVAVGNYAIASGLGLMHRIPNRSLLPQHDELRLRPFTSTWTDDALTGAAAHLRMPLDSVHIELLGAWSQRNGSDALLNMSAHIETSRFTINTSTRLSGGQFSGASVYANINIDRWLIITEVLSDASSLAAASIQARHDLVRGQVVLGSLWSAPEHDNAWRIYTGVQMGSSRTLRIETFTEIHGRHSRSFGRPMPTRGWDIVIDAQRSITSMISVDLRLRYEIDDEGWMPDGTSTMRMFARHRTTTRSAITIAAARDVRLRARIDVRHMWSDGERETELGLLGGADVMWTPRPNLRFTAQYVAANAPSVESAAYTVLIPVAGAMRMIAGTGEGSWLMVSGRWTVTPWCTLAAAMIEQRSRSREARLSTYLQAEVRLPK